MKLEPNEDGQLDIVMDANGAIIQETTFKTAVLTSLLWNRRADPEDVLPFAYQGVSSSIDADRQGWVGDILDEQGRLVGSKFWLLDQEINIDDTRLRAIEYVHQCLKWTIDDGHVNRVETDTETKLDRLNLSVSIFMANGDVLNLRLNYETGAVYVI